MLAQALLILYSAQICLANQDIGCFVPGMCINSEKIGASFPQDSNGCLSDCQALTDCKYFSYQFYDDFCVQYSECIEFVNQGTNETISGQASCDSLVCGDLGECQGTILDIKQTSNELACLDHCAANSDCQWWSFNSDNTPYCSLYSSCGSIDMSCQDCSHGQRHCKEGAPGIATTANPADTTPGFTPASTLLIFGNDNWDVISLDGKVCDDLADSPMGGSGSKAFSTNGGRTPNLCYSYCYEYDGTQWSPIGETIESRTTPTGVQINPETYWLYGGYYSYAEDNGEHYDNNAFQVWKAGPDPPEISSEGCAATLNENDVYLAGGFSSNTSVNHFYKYDWTARIYEQLPSSTFSHVRPICGIVQTEDRGPEFVVAGDADDIEIYNINSRTWRLAGAIPHDVNDAASLPFGDTFLYMGGSSSHNIYEWDSTTDSFKVRHEILPRAYPDSPAAVLIDGSILNCRPF